MKVNKHIAMWACPRSRSTAIARAFEQLPECLVYDEVLLGAYASKTNQFEAMGLNREKVTNTLEIDYKKVIETITGDLPDGKNFSFQKISTDEYVPEFGIDWVKKLTNFFLIRHPKDILLSLHSIMAKATYKGRAITANRVGVETLYRIFQEVEAITGKTPVVIHSDDLVKNPRQVLQWLCDHMGILFEEQMLTWEPGLKNSTLLDLPSLSVTSHLELWYATLKSSKSFIPYEKKETDLPEELIPVLEKTMPYYEKLLHHCQCFD